MTIKLFHARERSGPKPALGAVLAGSALALALTGCSLAPGFGLDSAPVRHSEARVTDVLYAPLDTRAFTLLAPEQDVLGEIQRLAAVRENTFSDLARQHNLGYSELRWANPDVDPWLPAAGAPIYLPTMQVMPAAPRSGIVINLASMRLLHFEPAPPAGGPPTVASYPIGIGREGWETPTGSLSITEKTRDPSWYPPASVRAEHAAAGDPLPAVVPPGPDNPLGLFKMRLSRPAYLIHGTNKPAGVGMRVSHGCIRLYPDDIAALFERTPLATAVHIVNEPVLAGWRDDRLYLEVHPPLAEDDRDLTSLANRAIAAAMARRPLPHPTVDEALVTRLVAAQHGMPVPITVPGLVEADYLATARPIRNQPQAADDELTASR